MSLTLLLGFSAVILIIGYRIYGRLVSKKLNIDKSVPTPAHSLRDGVDYIPSKKSIVLGHHFSSIAGAGPIIGPIIAVEFGWIPAVIWILVGGIFFGAVHDFTSMVASVRHDGKSIGSIIQKYIGLSGKRLFLIFGFATLILIIAVFTDIIAKTFIKDPGVASSSILFIILAILFGQSNRVSNSKLAFIAFTIVGVGLMYLFIYVGVKIPIELDYKWWVIILMTYAFFASVTPVSFLLQPRDYLSSFLLYGLMLAAIVGVIIANPDIKMDTNTSFKSEGMGYLFPVLFVTVACGAISGFHSLVASGTSSKQVDKESDIKLIGFGGMLIESFLAILSVGAVIILGRSNYTERILIEGPVSMFADGLGGIISSTGISAALAKTFVALAVSAFALTTLDTCTRLARLSFQEYCEDFNSKLGRKMTGNRYFASGLVVLFSFLLMGSGEFMSIWPIFGSANQLLAALSLLAISVWLMKKNVKTTFIMIPMFFMFVVALSSLFLFAVKNYNEGMYILALLAGLLFLLALVLLWLTRHQLKRLNSSKPY